MVINQSKQNKHIRYYFFIVPIIITILIYSVSLTYGFRNFDEDTIISANCTSKSFSEYLEKLFLIYSYGVSQAHGFAFSGIKNVHFSPLGIPLHYTICFLFNGIPFLFHLWSLSLHLLALFFLILLMHELTGNKLLALFGSLIWSIHPTNVEPIIWATNWACPLGAILYFFTLYKITKNIKEGRINKISFKFLTFLTALQIFLVEHTVTISITIFLLILYLTKSLTVSFKKALPSFVVTAIYFVIRFCCTSLNESPASFFNKLFERIIYLLPQTFIHNLKLILMPTVFSIDQLDHLTLDKNILGPVNIFCIIIFVLYLYISLITRNNLPFFSLGLMLYLVALLPFLQIVPLYSLVAERYNYFSSSFLIFGILTCLFKVLTQSSQGVVHVAQVPHYCSPFLRKYLFYVLVTLLVLLTIFLGTKSFKRIIEWQDSKTLFQSTINSSKSLLKKGIWTYNLALSEKDTQVKNELLQLSINLLKLFLEYQKPEVENNILANYELDTKSKLAKASLRIAQIYEILKERKLQHKYLSIAYSLTLKDNYLKSQVYKGLGTYYFQTKNYKKAASYYKKSYLISKEPNILFATSVCYLKLNDLSGYEDYLKKSVSVISSNNAGAFKAYGHLLEAYRNNIIEAIKYYKIATLLENKPKPYVLLATSYLKLNKIEKAHDIIKKGLHSFPNNSSLLYLKGTILISKGKLKSGIKTLSLVATSLKAPRDIKIAACQILIDTFVKQNNLSEAKKYNEVLLSINSSGQ